MPVLTITTSRNGFRKAKLLRIEEQDADQEDRVEEEEGIKTGGSSAACFQTAQDTQVDEAGEAVGEAKTTNQSGGSTGLPSRRLASQKTGRTMPTDGPLSCPVALLDLPLRIAVRVDRSRTVAAKPASLPLASGRVRTLLASPVLAARLEPASVTTSQCIDAVRDNVGLGAVAPCML